MIWSAHFNFTHHVITFYKELLFGFKEEFRENPITSFPHFVFSVLHHYLFCSTRKSRAVIIFSTLLPLILKTRKYFRNPSWSIQVSCWPRKCFKTASLVGLRDGAASREPGAKKYKLFWITENSLIRMSVFLQILNSDKRQPSRSPWYMPDML